MMADAEVEADIARYREHGDLAARERVILDTAARMEGLIRSLHSRRFPHVDLDDVRQKAVPFIIDAVERFGYDRPGSHFRKYVTAAIWRNVPPEVNRDGGPFSLTRAIVDRQGRYLSTERARRRAGLSVEPGDVMDAMGIAAGSSIRDWLPDLARLSGREWWRSIGEEGVDPAARDAGPVSASRAAAGRVDSLLATLRPRWAEIVRRRFGIGVPEETEAEVARSMGLTQQGVNYAFYRAMDQLRAAG